MNRILIIRGSHDRHKFLCSGLDELCDEIRYIELQREDVLPKAPEEALISDRNLFSQHFEKRLTLETKAFKHIADLHGEHLSVDKINTYSTMRDLNNRAYDDCIAGFHPDICIVFGTELIKEPLLSKLPENTFNIHLGLSPWYKGDATLFWPFYFLEPNHAGVTFHKLEKTPDSGMIIHQLRPKLKFGMTLHDVGVASVVEAKKHLQLLVRKLLCGHAAVFKKQITTGRTFRGCDFRPEHLRVNYDLFGDQMVDAFLDGEIQAKSPNLISFL